MTVLRRRPILKLVIVTLAIPVIAQTPQDDSWNRVLAQETVAFRLLEQEQRSTGAQQQRVKQERIAAFRQVGERLNEYRTGFIKDRTSVSEVNALFRMGYYMEFAGWDDKALLFYQTCSEHSKLREPGAVFGQPARPLQPQVQERIAAVSSRMNQGTNPGASLHSLSTLAHASIKGGIDLPGTARPPDPLNREEALTVAQRMSFPEELPRARQDWRKLLEQDPQLLPVTEDSSVPGILVFGVKGTPQNTKRVATTLDKYRKELVGRYFDAGLPAPTMVVFANLLQPEAAPQSSTRESPAQQTAATRNRAQQSAVQQTPVQQSPARQSPVQQSPAQQGPTPQNSEREQVALRTTSGQEQLGRALSSRLHFRDMDSLEGYFEPLDHTLVLRKNLLGPDGKIFLGTGLHELVHALIRVDFAQAPPWLNEGLAALHEEYGPDGPQDNYRLYVARAAMQATGRWPSVAQLLNARTTWWTDEPRTIMTAAARYFCMFLWKQGKLPAVYKALRDSSPNQSAADVLQRVTGMSIQDLDAAWNRDIASRDPNKLNSKWSQLRGPIDVYVRSMPELISIQ
jgi:hypothetical protein